MEDGDEKAALLSEITKIYDKYKNRGTWIYIILILIYFICSFFYIFPEIFSKIFPEPPEISTVNLLIPCIMIGVTVIFIFLICREEKKGNPYERFCSEVKDYSDDKLLFLNDYIEYLLSKNKRNNNEKVITLVFIPLFINIAANKIGQLEGLYFWLKLIEYLFWGIFFIIIYNMLPYTFNLEVLKLLRVKRFIEYALLCRRMEKLTVPVSCP